MYQYHADFYRVRARYGASYIFRKLTLIRRQ